jgi:hypothetical protein
MCSRAAPLPFHFSMPPLQDLRHGPLVLLLAGALLAGCSATAPLAPAPPPVDAPLPRVEHGGDIFTIYEIPAGEEPAITPDVALLTRLHAAHQRWDGTPYRFGAASRDGTDCSGFVQRVFAETFGMALSRSTGTQVLEGEEISRDELRPGDLVFFQTGRRQRHVGIYLRNGHFLHASTQRGVTIDRLGAGYYDRTYWTARRVLSDDLVASLVPVGGAQAAHTATPRSTTPASRAQEPPARSGGVTFGAVSAPSGAAASGSRRSGW